jgi:DNA polymerase-3 subunit chi
MSFKVSFYILNESTKKTCALYTCRIIEKIYNVGNSAYIYTSTKEAQNFDTQLWTFRDISFIPHEIYDQNQNINSPIVIGCSNQIPKKKYDFLVNLTSDLVSFYKHFIHIIEVVPKYKIYQKDNAKIETFNISLNSQRCRHYDS